jgi:hypothetical protein
LGVIVGGFNDFVIAGRPFLRVSRTIFMRREVLPPVAPGAIIR